MTVDIITANYNYGRFLGACIESVLHQSYADWRLWVCDDGSTDGSRAVVARYADPRIHWLAGEHSGGPAAPRNRGIRAGSGAYVAIVDADDMLTRDSLEKRVGCLERTGVDLVCGQTLRVSDTTSLDEAYAIDAAVEVYSFCRMPTLLLKRSLIEAGGLFDERLLRYEEKEWLIRLVLSGRPHRKAVLPDVVAYYRVHDANISRRRAADPETDAARYEAFVGVVSAYAPDFPFARTRRSLRSAMAGSRWCRPR